MQKKEAADQEGLKYDLEDPLVVIPSGKVDYDIATYWPPFHDEIYCLRVHPMSADFFHCSQTIFTTYATMLQLSNTPRMLYSGILIMMGLFTWS